MTYRTDPEITQILRRLSELEDKVTQLEGQMVTKQDKPRTTAAWEPEHK